jgi:hypothetical protein
MPDFTHAVTHRLRVDPSRTMRSVTGEVAKLLDGMEEEPRRSGALLATELIAQVAGSSPDWNHQPIGLTIEQRGDVVRFEAAGPVSPAIGTSAGDDVAAADPVAAWGPFVMDRLADRWGLGVGPQRSIWAEISTP